MKNKILVSGKNSALVKDFMIHTNTYFRCISTSDYYVDVVEHFNLFEPEVYVCFIESGFDDNVSQLHKLKTTEEKFKSIPVVVVGTEESCVEFENSQPYDAEIIVQRPISADNIALRILKMLDRIKEEKEKENEIIKLKIEAENSKKHILIVDDDRNMLKILKNSLSQKYDVTTMINGLLVEKFLEIKNVDLIVLDYEMPIENGAEIFRKLKNNEKYKDIPVCFLTGVSERSKIEEIMMLRPHGYLLKPINIEMLKSTIFNIIN